MGVTVRQKTKGRGQPWWIFIHHNGKLRSKKIGDRTAAEAVASEIRKGLKAGELNLQSGKREANTMPTFGKYSQHFMEHYAQIALKWATWTNYEQVLRDHILPHWEHKRLDEVSRSDVKKLLLTKSAEGFAPGTVQNIQITISSIFTHAYEDEIIKAHPAQRMGKYIGKRDSRAHVNPLTTDQARHFLETCQVEYPLWYPLMLCAFRTGMRLGEIMGVAWEDIDFEGNRIEVRRAYSHGRYSTPKSNKSRIVDMSDQLRVTLLAHQGDVKQRFGRLPSVKAPSVSNRQVRIRPVFVNRAGKPVDADRFRSRVFYKLIELSGLPHFRFHDIRHTFASLLLQNGESLHYVKEQMGHASIQTTVDVYGHLVPGSNRQAVNNLDDPTPGQPAPTLKLTASAG